MLVCSSCHAALPESEFNRDNHSKRGRQYRCRECNRISSTISNRARGELPMADNRSCSSFLGVLVAEQALSRFFDNITRMPYGNRGFDFVCGKGYKIDVKSSCMYYSTPRAHTKSWKFTPRRNKVPDYFLLLAFDSRASLVPMHVWLVPGNVINDRGAIRITDCPTSLARLAAYERPLDKVVACCTAMREKGLV